MKILDIVTLVNGKILCGDPTTQDQVDYCFASDLMSDVLTVRRSDFLLMTGLANVQSIRTAEMSDLQYVLLVRGKEPTADMLDLARENGIILLQSPFSMFKTSGLLYNAGMQGVY